jgi:hypothetical protein
MVRLSSATLRPLPTQFFRGAAADSGGAGGGGRKPGGQILIHQFTGWQLQQQGAPFAGRRQKNTAESSRLSRAGVFLLASELLGLRKYS